MENLIMPDFAENELENLDTTEQKYVIFKLKDEYYGIDINNVKSIEKAQDFTRVPNAKNFIKGVINLRGEVIPVIDLRKRLGFQEKEEDSNSRIIIVMLYDIQIGLLVDSSSEVITFDESEKDSAQALNENEIDDFANHIGKKDGRLVILVDLMKIINYEV